MSAIENKNLTPDAIRYQTPVLNETRINGFADISGYYFIKRLCTGYIMTHDENETETEYARRVREAAVEEITKARKML